MIANIALDCIVYIANIALDCIVLEPLALGRPSMACGEDPSSRLPFPSI